MFDGSMPDVRPPIIINISEIRPHPGQCPALAAVSNASLEANLFELLSTQIMEEEVARRVVGHEDIQKAIAIEVSKGNAHAFAHSRGNSRLLRNVRKSTISIVSVKCIVEWRVILGMAVAAHIAVQRADRILIHFPLAVIDNEEVEQTVIVIVEPPGAHGPHFVTIEQSTAYARSRCHVGKRSVSVVMKSLIAGYVYDEQIGPSVIIVITH